MRRLALLALIAAACADPREGASQHQLCTSNPNGPCCPGSPIVVDLRGDGIHLTSARDGVIFKLRPGHVSQWAWTLPDTDDAFLALDRDDDGRITDGSELFGDGSPQAASSSPNGFRALAVFDWAESGGNEDGLVDARDAVWPRLRLWRDTDHDGVSAFGELLSLDASGVHGFSLAADPSPQSDEHGNEFRFTSHVIADAPVSPVATDVWLTQTFPAQRDYVDYTCYAWGYWVVAVSPSTACATQWVWNDPIVTVGGVYTRLVVRSSTSTNLSLAMSDAQDSVKSVTLPDCWMAAFPDPDPYRAAPYNTPGYPPTIPRVKCISHTHQTGGGGC